MPKSPRRPAGEGSAPARPRKAAAARGPRNKDAARTGGPPAPGDAPQSGAAAASVPPASAAATDGRPSRRRRAAPKAGAGAAPPKSTAKAAAQAAAGAGPAGRGRIRVYRHGLGDCHLISLATAPGRPDFRIMIDCGVILGTPDAGARMTAVVEDIAAETGGRIDLLVLTHEHWDHLSGFNQAAEAIGKLTFGAVWVAWTEDPADALANELRRERAAALAALQLAAPALAMAGGGPACETVTDLLGFFGAAGSSTRDAFDAAKKKAPLRFCRPGDDPVRLDGADVTVYVLGPPPDARLIRRTLAAKGSAETYGLALDGSGAMSAGTLAALTDPGADRPFADTCVIPEDIARGMPFFRETLWGPGAEAWRGIGGDWLGGAAELALALDSATNNTSLVLALEFPDGAVALLVGDAQVGNWESWQALSWTVGGRTVTGPDLLARTTFYKVGHHGSHNATLRANGLEAMTALRTAVIPVDHAMALKKRWGQMPLPALIDALNARTDGRVLRTDQAPAVPLEGVRVDPLYFEIAL